MGDISSVLGVGSWDDGTLFLKGAATVKQTCIVRHMVSIRKQIPKVRINAKEVRISVEFESGFIMK